MTNLDTLNDKIEKTKDLIKKQYLCDDGNLTWLIGYSGGKDSTVLAQLVFKSIYELSESNVGLERKIIIFSSDTLIENPLVKVIIENNINLINKQSRKFKLPISAIILSPTLDNTFWVNVIGKGYPTPNTMFRWCTDRMKILPADTFVKKYIDENREVIMVLGVREGESGARDRVLKTHNIEGETLMKHTTMHNAYVFAPIKSYETKEIFLYLNQVKSPWGSNNKELYFFYEESGAGECPIFLSQQDKTSTNSCGNSRMGCWCCTVVTKDKSLTGFIETGWHEELKPLLDFRNWLVSIRDNQEYRYFHRMNGSVYMKKLDTKIVDNNKLLILAGKERRNTITVLIEESGELDKNSGYILLLKEDLPKYMKSKKLTFKDSFMSKIILKDSITDEYYKIGTGPFNEKARYEIITKLLKTESEYNRISKNKTKLISDEEINEIKRIWLRSSLDIGMIDKIIKENNRKPVEFIQDSFEIMNQKYILDLKKILEKNNLDIEILANLVQNERDCINKKKDDMQKFLASIFEADKINYQ